MSRFDQVGWAFVMGLKDVSQFRQDKVMMQNHMSEVYGQLVQQKQEIMGKYVDLIGDLGLTGLGRNRSNWTSKGGSWRTISGNWSRNNRK